MPAERLSMRQIREVLRLCWESGLPQREAARSLGLGQGTVSAYLSRARAAGLTWPRPEDLDDAGLGALLFPPLCGVPADHRPLPDWAWVHRELRRPDVTLALLWEEYRAGAPDNGFGYSWFCDLYRAWAGRLKPMMRQVHLAGEKLFVDFAGRTGEVVDANTGEIVPVQIFVAVLGASSLTYAGDAARRHHHAGPSPPMISAITITGIGDQLRPEWPITFTGMHNRHQRGFTLLEVVIALAIAALALVVLFRAGADGLLAVSTVSRAGEAVQRAQSHLAALGRDAPLLRPIRW